LKAAIVVWWRYCRGVCFEEIRKTTKHQRIFGVLPEILSELLPNKNFERYHCTSLLGILRCYFIL
jgi:hypothetical protein